MNCNLCALVYRFRTLFVGATSLKISDVRLLTKEEFETLDDAKYKTSYWISDLTNNKLLCVNYAGKIESEPSDSFFPQQIDVRPVITIDNIKNSIAQIGDEILFKFRDGTYAYFQIISATSAIVKGTDLNRTVEKTMVPDMLLFWKTLFLNSESKKIA